MQTPALAQCLTTYQQWKTRVSRAVLDLERWLEAHERATPASGEALAATLDALERDRLTIAFVAERSRGKSELINAMVFSDLGGRLLPSAAGGAIVCPTEILWDGQRKEPYLRLLPIETRARDTSLAALKVDPKQWVHYPLDPNAPEQMAATLKELVRTKSVPAAEATRLGLAAPDVAAARAPETDQSAADQSASDPVEIPRWRYAVVSLPHPLLKQGLVVVDTPGVEVLRGEPELSAGLLTAAQAVVFLLAADSGASPGDLEIWQRHLKAFRSAPGAGDPGRSQQDRCLLGGRGRPQARSRPRSPSGAAPFAVCSGSARTRCSRSREGRAWSPGCAGMTPCCAAAVCRSSNVNSRAFCWRRNRSAWWR